MTCSARLSLGVTYTQRPSGFCDNILNMANSAQIVLPLPVGAPMKMLSSLLYTALNTEKNKVKIDNYKYASFFIKIFGEKLWVFSHAISFRLKNRIRKNVTLNTTIQSARHMYFIIFLNSEKKKKCPHCIIINFIWFRSVYVKLLCEFKYIHWPCVCMGLK